jgi:hypothetical protein
MTRFTVIPALACAALTFMSSAQAGPAITFEKDSHDYGRVYYGDKVTAEFPFINSGDETLRIEKLRSSCGCTRAVEGAGNLPPKHKSKIVAAFETEGLSPGKKQKTIFVQSNDPKKPVVKLTLYADVIREVEVEPLSLTRRLPDFTESVSFPLKATNTSKQSIILDNVRIFGGKATASLAPDRLQIAPGKSVEFNVVLKLERSEGSHYYMGRMVLSTDHPKEKEIELRYLVQVEKAG